MSQPGVHTHRLPGRKRPEVLRQALSSALLLVLFLHPQAWHSWTLLLQANIKSEVAAMQAGEAPEKIRPVWLRIPAKWITEGHPDLVWTEPDEFRYHGEMYDILSQEQRGDTIWYYCHHDEEETALVNGLLEQLQQPEETAGAGDMLHLLGLLFDKWQICKTVALLSADAASQQALYSNIEPVASRNGDAPCPPPPRHFFFSFST